MAHRKRDFNQSQMWYCDTCEEDTVHRSYRPLDEDDTREQSGRVDMPDGIVGYRRLRRCESCCAEPLETIEIEASQLRRFIENSRQRELVSELLTRLLGAMKTTAFNTSGSRQLEKVFRSALVRKAGKKA